jgi:TrmH family RNA methyltransferase
LRGQSPRNLYGRRRKTTPQGEVGARRRPLLIHSRENDKLKLVRKLQERSWRDKLGLFVAEGEDLVNAARDAGFEAVEVLVAGENVEPALLAEVSTLGHPPRVIGVFRRRESAVDADVALALWRVSDPGNVGTLLRSADAFGAGVMLSKGCADPFGPKALRAAMGSTFRVRLPEFELSNAVALVADGGTPLDELELDRYSTFVLGAEREGLPAEIVERCRARATIPVERVDSLNVAMAGTIVLYARARRATQTVSSPPA